MASLRTFYLQLLKNGPTSLCGYVAFLGLWPLSCVYGVAVRLRLFAYSSDFKTIYRAKVPIISVGNLTVGGTGKTPMTDFLAKWMQKHEVKASIVSRGYGGDYTDPVLRVVLAGAKTTQPLSCGDEPFLLARKNPSVPVFVARRRALGVKAAEETGAELIILDDGFQHRAVHRDLDIVLLDSNKPFGNGHMLPAGPLREPLTALNRSHLLVMTRSFPEKENTAIADKPTLLSCHTLAQRLSSLSGDHLLLSDLVGKSCVAFAGIARPEDFFAGLREHHLTLKEEISLADHQVYDETLINRLSKSCQGADALITTEKDAVKLAGFTLPIPCYQVGVEMTFFETKDLDEMLLKLISRAKSVGDLH
jgi:tetraacyldisaccharide 4'-kinase